MIKNDGETLNSDKWYVSSRKTENTAKFKEMLLVCFPDPVTAQLWSTSQFSLQHASQHRYDTSCTGHYSVTYRSMRKKTETSCRNRCEKQNLRLLLATTASALYRVATRVYNLRRNGVTRQVADKIEPLIVSQSAGSRKPYRLEARIRAHNVSGSLTNKIRLNLPI